MANMSENKALDKTGLSKLWEIIKSALSGKQDSLPTTGTASDNYAINITGNADTATNLANQGLVQCESFNTTTGKWVSVASISTASGYQSGSNLFTVVQRGYPAAIYEFRLTHSSAIKVAQWSYITTNISGAITNPMAYRQTTNDDGKTIFMFYVYAYATNVKLNVFRSTNAGALTFIHDGEFVDALTEDMMVATPVTPSASNVSHSLSFGKKTYDGSAAESISASDLLPTSGTAADNYAININGNAAGLIKQSFGQFMYLTHKGAEALVLSLGAVSNYASILICSSRGDSTAGCWPVVLCISFNWSGTAWTNTPSVVYMYTPNQASTKFSPIVKFDADGNIYIYYGSGGDTARLFYSYQGSNAELLSWVTKPKTDVPETATEAAYEANVSTSNAGTAIGSSDTPVYIAANGFVKACTTDNLKAGKDGNGNTISSTYAIKDGWTAFSTTTAACGAKICDVVCSASTNSQRGSFLVTISRVGTASFYKALIHFEIRGNTFKGGMTILDYYGSADIGNIKFLYTKESGYKFSLFITASTSFTYCRVNAFAISEITSGVSVDVSIITNEPSGDNVTEPVEYQYANIPKYSNIGSVSQPVYCKNGVITPCNVYYA